MRIILIRHGQSEADILNVHEGSADFTLTEEGRRQAKCMSKYVAENYQVDRIFASTLKRAKETAEILSEKINVSIAFEEELKEYDNGKLAGLNFEEAAIKYPKLDNVPIHKSVYGKESLLHFRTRAEKIMSKIISETGNHETIVIVSHGKMISELYHVFLSMPISSNIFFTTADVGIHEWIIDGDNRYVIKSNFITTN